MAKHRRLNARQLFSHDIPETMTAAAIDRFGPPSALTSHHLPVPKPGPQEVLIAIETAGVGTVQPSF